MEKSKVTRVTRQGTLIESIFVNSERPLTVDDVHSIAVQTTVGIGIATVYRAIQKLEALGSIVAVTFPGTVKTYYERHKAKYHQHFICKSCEHAHCVADVPVRWHQILPRGFTLSECKVTLTGLCADCQTLPKQ